MIAFVLTHKVLTLVDFMMSDLVFFIISEGESSSMCIFGDGTMSFEATLWLVIVYALSAGIAALVFNKIWKLLSASHLQPPYESSKSVEPAGAAGG